MSAYEIGSKNWDKAKIAVRILYPDPNNLTLMRVHTCVLPNRLTIKTSFNYQPYHGLTQWNQGVIERPPEFTFTIAVPATSESVRLLRALHVSGVPFRIDVKDAYAGNVPPATSTSDSQHAENLKREFALYTEALIEARITTKEMSVSVGELPMVVFNGMALRYTFSDGMYDGIDQDGGTNVLNEQFGSGEPITASLFKEWGE